MDEKEIDNIPQQIRSYPNWVCYRLVNNGKPKLDKVPYDPKKPGRKAKADVPETWGTFNQAIKVAKANKFDGIGFEFSRNDPFCGIDLDHCVKNGIILPMAQSIINQLNSYSEYSPSGNGVHIIVEATKPGSNCKYKDKESGIEVEMYDHGRFFTMTGRRV